MTHLSQAEPAREVVKGEKGKRFAKSRQYAEKTEQKALDLPAEPQRSSGLVSTGFAPTS